MLWNWRDNRTGAHLVFSPDEGGGANGGGGQGGNGSGAGASSAGTQTTEHMIPKSRLDEALKEAREAKEALAKLQTDAQTAEEARMAEQGRFKELADSATRRVAELEPFKAEADANRQVILKANEGLIAQIPEDIRETIVPKGLPPHQLYAWLNANVPILLKKAAPNLDAGAGGGGGGGTAATMTAEEKMLAQLGGMTNEQWLKAKAKAEAAKA